MNRLMMNSLTINTNDICKVKSSTMCKKVSLKNKTLAELMDEIELIEQQLEDLPTPTNNTKKWLKDSSGRDHSWPRSYS